MLVSQIKETDKRLFKSSNMAAKTSHEKLFNPNEKTHLFQVRYVSKQQMYVIFSSLRWTGPDHLTSSVFRVHKVSEERSGGCHYR